MTLSRSILACVAAAVAVSTQGVSMEVDSAISWGAVDAPAAAGGKHIAGVPVLHYDKAYTGRTMRGSTLSAAEVGHQESWIVVMKPGTPREELHKGCRRAKGCSLVGEHPSFPFIAMRGAEDELAAVVEPMRDDAKYIDLDRTVTVGHPEYSSVSQKEDEAANAVPPLWGLDRIGKSKATTRGAGVSVYVADMGIRTDHEEFGGRAFAWLDVFNETHTPSRFCNESSDEACAEDGGGQGTHNAGIVAGQTYGVAPEAMVYAVKVLNNFGFGQDSEILFGMGMVASEANRPAVLSMSMPFQLPGVEQLYVDAVDALALAGVAVVVSAGDEYRDACKDTPAFVPRAITVGATAFGDVREIWSNFGSCVDIWAPGFLILSSVAWTTRNGSLALTGTFKASSHVSGAAALLLEEKPLLSPEQVREELLMRASKNYIKDLSPACANEFLYVGSDGPEPNQSHRDDPWPPEEFFGACEAKGQDGPRPDYSACMCRDRADIWDNGTLCYDGDADEPGCPVSAVLAARNKEVSDRDLTHYYFLPNCTSCTCRHPTVSEFTSQGPMADTIIFGIIGTFAVVLACIAMFTLARKKTELSDPALEMTDAP